MKNMTLLRSADLGLAIGCFVAVFFTHGLWQIMWGLSAVFCAASAWWCWADRLNAYLKKWLLRTSLGAALRLHK